MDDKYNLRNYRQDFITHMKIFDIYIIIKINKIKAFINSNSLKL